MGNKPIRVIVTRPAQDAANWVDKLTNSGFKAQALPLIEIGPASGLADITALKHAWLHLDKYAACMFVSGNAVQYFFEKKMAASQSNGAQAAPFNVADKAINWLPTSLRFLAPGPATAAALLAVGVPAGQIDSPPTGAGQFDSEALWQVVGSRDWHGKRVLLLRGQTSGAGQQAAAGRDWLALQFRAAGAQLDMLSVYERQAPQLSSAQLDLVKAASQDGTVWLFSSSEALVNLLRQPALKGGKNWRQARAIATHPRIAEAVCNAGWGVVQESRPMLSDIVDALRSIESGTP